MPTNFELKARIPWTGEAREAAERCGATFAGRLIQTDTYYEVPFGRLKLRELGGGTAELIFYERAEATDERWSRYTKFPMADPAGVHRALAGSLGVRVVIRKTRDLYRIRSTRIHIDEVEGLGAFIEFEIQDQDELTSSREMEFLRQAFGIVPEAIIRGSYADMPAGRAVPR